MSGSPALTPWCQRWRDRQHSWRHATEPFTPARYSVEPIRDRDAKAFCLTHHYATSYPAAIHRYGLIDHADGQLVGVAVLAAPASHAVLTTAFPTLTPYSESVELARFVLLDQVPAPAESWMLARIFRDVRDHGVRGVVTFADPMPRHRSDGVQVKPGHLGIIYQASNALYYGRGTARTVTLLPDGTVLHDRAAQKVRSQETGHRYVEDRLATLGATPITPTDNPTRWLTAALREIQADRIRHPGNHRYLFRLGKGRDRDRIQVGPTARPYPKRFNDTQQHLV